MALSDFADGRFDERALDDAQEWVRSFADQAAERAASAQRMAEQVAGITVTAHDPSGAITVTVDASGGLSRLELSDAATARGGTRLAQEIMATLRQAQAGLAAQVGAVVAATVGAGTRTGATVINSFERRFPRPDRPEGTDAR